MIWFASDHHFGHTNLIRYVGRPFENVDEMNEEMTARWNEVVSSRDTVYYPGDFTLGDDAAQFFRCLNGRIYVVPGGHDYRWIRKQRDRVFSRSGPVEVLDPLYTLELPQEGKKWPLVIVLCHYMMRSWPRSHYNTWHIHGHHHRRVPYLEFQGKVLNVCVDHHNFYPWSLDEVVAYMERQSDNTDFVGNRKEK